MVFAVFPRRKLNLRPLSATTLYLLAISYATAADVRPSYHITPPSNWLNDPQRAFFLEGEWHMYYLYNSDFNFANPRSGGGTEWFHVTSTDLVSWTPRAVAIEKYKPNQDGVNLGDIETGSAVVDTDNAAGLGANAVIAIATQMGDGIQQQSLFYSNDNGYKFTPFPGNPIMPSPDPSAKPDFRDPKVIWDGARSQWVIALAEGSRIGFYTSKDLKAWVYRSGFIPKDSGVDLGLLECPDLFQMDADGDPTKRTWVLAAGGNGFNYGRTTGTAYWTGTWNGTQFTTTNILPQWMDNGPDFYASISWSDSRLTGNQAYATRYALGWMNNWAYANDLPYYGGWAGQLSMVRDIKLKSIGDSLSLVGMPTSSYVTKFGNSTKVTGKSITTNPTTASLPVMAGQAYMIDMTISKNSGNDGNEVRLLIKGDGSFGTTVGFDFVRSQASLVRDNDGTATDSMPQNPKAAYDTIRTAPVAMQGTSVKLSVYVDANSVEVFVNDGVAVLSGLMYPNAEAKTIKLTSATGSLTLDSFAYADAK